MRLSKQTIALGAVGIADLVSTLWLWRVHGATEANPLMALFLAQGVVAFIVAKVVLLAAPLTVMEWARRRRPAFVARASTIALLAYVGIYAVGVTRLNAEPSGYPTMDAAARQIAWRRMRVELASRAIRHMRVGNHAPPICRSYPLAVPRDVGDAERHAEGSM